MPTGTPIGKELKERVIDAFLNNEKQADIARRFQLPRYSVSKIIIRYNERGHLNNNPKSGRPRKTTINMDRRIKRISENDPWKSSSKIIAEIPEVGVSTRTIQRRLVAAKLFSRRPAKKPLISRFSVGVFFVELCGSVEGNMDRFIYKDILQDVMLPYAEWEMPLRFIFQQDNDPKHTSALVNLNPIENLWEEVERRIRIQKFPNKQSLIDKIKEVWSNLDENVIQKLISSMPRRCQKIILNNGYAINY
ncbi:Transposable element Tcb2 transposase-like Protein [Tribolium castaneum]|uniref:Transposable element Tcb2 transposase-like Protein n=2 Tax=Tribolium castaneum TaxID=7070 RepID=D6X0I2_TRICA|nr:Transposable element Tcb2 transposase-like Protein [Tribolium castaneum]